MILKFIDPVYKSDLTVLDSNEKNSKVAECYIVYGDISKVSWSSELYQPPDEDTEEWPIAFQGIDTFIPRRPKVSTMDHVYQIVKFNQGEETVVVAYACPAYLCNDKGDTIERISL